MKKMLKTKFKLLILIKLNLYLLSRPLKNYVLIFSSNKHN